MLTAVGWFVSSRIVEPRLGPWTGGADAALDIESPHIDSLERRGLIVAGLALLVTVGIVLMLVVPAGGPLRDAQTGGIKPFYDSLVGLLMIVFVVPGLAYGLMTRKIRSDRDAAKMMGQTMSAMGTYVVMAFFAGQFNSWPGSASPSWAA
jgi:aminobenzoyl-glutamate transport protein